MDKSVDQSNVEKNATPAESMSRSRISIYAFFGILLPVFALYVNYRLLGGSSFDMLYAVGTMFMLPCPAYLYVTIGSGIVTLLLWMIFFRKYGKRCNGFIGGILLFNAFFDLAFGIAAVYRLWLIPVWLPPFCAAPILFLSGIRALRIALSVMLKRQVAVTAIAGFLFVVTLSLFIVKQPWGLIKHLPNAKGVNLSGMDLRHIFLDGWSGVTFEEANLSYANLSYACLSRCNLNMHKVNLYKANLSHAVLSNTNLTGADLRGANLNNTVIFEVDFTGTNFQGTVLDFHAGRVVMEDVNLCGADLREIKNISGVEVWKGAVYNSATLWPKKFDPVKEGAVLLADEKTTGSH